jgi:hypothetical protein
MMILRQQGVSGTADTPLGSGVGSRARSGESYDGFLVPRSLADGRPNLILCPLHVRMIPRDVLARGPEQPLVVLGAQLVSAGAINDATH